MRKIVTLKGSFICKAFLMLIERGSHIAEFRRTRHEGLAFPVNFGRIGVYFM